MVGVVSMACMNLTAKSDPAQQALIDTRFTRVFVGADPGSYRPFATEPAGCPPVRGHVPLNTLDGRTPLRTIG